MKKDRIIFGAAYYEEYLPYDRLEQDMRLMAEAGFNTIRIAESTWSVEEPRPGEYDFSHIDRVIDAAERYGLDVIIGTPTYAVPHWLVQMDPNVLAETKTGKNRFGPRQNMDITNPTYLKYAEGIIRALVSHTYGRKNVIGFQIDNETKHYGLTGPRVLEGFQKWLKARFGSIEAVNYAFGLNYWSGSVTAFEDLPDPTGTANGSYSCAFDQYRRQLAAEFLQWQAGIVNEYRRPDQFVTHNFDYEWKSFGPPGHQDGFSGGIQPGIDHYDAAKAVSLVGTDIYSFAQDGLNGWAHAFGGDLMRSLKQDNYLVLESQAQAFKDWLPYPGQLRLMAYSHLASGACGMLYWGWYSLHNGLESYWKGILSHDFATNPTYEEVKVLGAELNALSPRLAGFHKQNRIAVVVSNEALSGLEQFPSDKDLTYNDVVRWVYDTLYEMNLECDIIFAKERDWSRYDLLIFPALYAVSEDMAERVRRFVERGGTVLATFRSFFADENVKIFHDRQPHGLTDCFGMTYNQYTRPVNVTLEGEKTRFWMELLIPSTADTVARYTHKYWGKYAAVTRNTYGEGHAWYIGTMFSPNKLKEYLLAAASDAGITPPEAAWPVIVRSGTNAGGERLHFFLNYSSEASTVSSPWHGTDILTGARYQAGEPITLPDWGVCVLAEVP